MPERHSYLRGKRSKRRHQMAQYKAKYRLIKPSTKGGIFYYRLGSDPKRIRHSTGCRTEKAAREFCESLISDESPIQTTLTFEKFTKDFFIPGKCQFLSNRESDGHRVNAKITKDYRAYLTNYLLPYFSNFHLTNINTTEIRKWRTSIMEGKLKPSSLKGKIPANNTINKVFGCLSIILDVAEESGLMVKNPCKKINILPKTSFKQRDILTKEEIRKLFPTDTENLLKIWDNWENVSLIYLSLSSGMRSGEIRAITWGDIDWINNAVYITKAIKAENILGCTKNGKERPVLPPKKAFVYLQQWKQLSVNNKGTDRVFIGRDGESPVSGQKIRNVLNRALKKLGLY